ncbi:MAG: aminotransferase class III-fold pyridoxal phosphate-dependent enzyme [Firmicutes bacterium]|nr:aminotransferase class III-fold pyridoxal phosphate-dependent enzyme [Bacillota bacterium]
MTEQSVRDVVKTDLEHVWHPMLQHKGLERNPPMVVTGARGSTIVDGDGREYLDAMAGLWCVNVGYGRKEIADAVYRQLLELPYYPHLQINRPAAELADKLAELTGGRLRHTYFVNSGTEANEAAMKLARQYQRQVRPGEPRYKFISRYLSYHGTSLATLAAGGVPERKTRFGPYGDGFVHVPPPYPYRCPFGGLEPEASELASARALEHAILAEGPETVAAVIMEPIQSGVGVLVPSPAYWREVQAICRRYGVLLILDEVINGFGRTGRWFAYEHYGLEPDLVSVAKGITSGYQPLGAVLATDAVFEAFLGEPHERREAVQVNTWGGHAAACAAGLETLRIMEEEDLPGAAAQVGAHLLAGLETLKELPWVGDVRGKGLLAAVELVADKETRQPLDSARVAAVVQGCKERGVIVGRSGGIGAGLGNCITLAPPLVLTIAEADRIVDVLQDTLQSLR